MKKKHLFSSCSLVIAIGLVTGCFEQKISSPERLFLNFVNSKEILKKPPAHRFRQIQISPEIPGYCIMAWGQSQQHFANFKVKKLFGQPVVPLGENADYGAALERYRSLNDLEVFDWINGRNSNYGFGVKKVDGKFFFRG